MQYVRREFLARIGLGAASLAMGERAWSAETSTRGSRLSLEESMRRAGQCCLAWLDPSQRFLPTGGYEVAHDTGRCVDALLRLEAATGFRLPASQESALLENVRALADNPAGILMNSAKFAGLKVQANPHNLRESMLAYHALARYRKSDWARQQGHRLLETISRLLKDDGQMDYRGLATLVGADLNLDPLMVQQSPSGQWFDGTATTGRAIEGILWFHEATGDPLAKEVAARLARVHLPRVTRPNGQVPPEILDANHIGHNHSYLGTLRGLLLYGLASGEREYVEAVAAAYRTGLFGTVISESGWTPHDLGKVRFPNADGDPLGEHASCGDVVQLALWLALRAGHVSLLDDVERLIRARLLPSQIDDPANPRQHGAWGVYSHPFGRGSIFDVFAAVLHTMTDVYQHVVTREADSTVLVHLHFGVETPWASVRASRSELGRLTVLPKSAKALKIRVPGWAPRATLRLTASGKPLPLAWDGPYLKISAADAAEGVELAYELPRRETVEIMPVSRRAFRITWRGDDVVACDPETPIYPRH